MDKLPCSSEFFKACLDCQQIWTVVCIIAVRNIIHPNAFTAWTARRKTSNKCHQLIITSYNLKTFLIFQMSTLVDRRRTVRLNRRFRSYPLILHKNVFPILPDLKANDSIEEGEFLARLYSTHDAICVYSLELFYHMYRTKTIILWTHLASRMYGYRVDVGNGRAYQAINIHLLKTDTGPFSIIL